MMMRRLDLFFEGDAQDCTEWVFIFIVRKLNTMNTRTMTPERKNQPAAKLPVWSTINPNKGGMIMTPVEPNVKLTPVEIPDCSRGTISVARFIQIPLNPAIAKPKTMTMGTSIQKEALFASATIKLDIAVNTQIMIKIMTRLLLNK